MTSRIMRLVLMVKQLSVRIANNQGWGASNRGFLTHGKLCNRTHRIASTTCSIASMLNPSETSRTYSNSNPRQRVRAATRSVATSTRGGQQDQHGHPSSSTEHRESVGPAHVTSSSTSTSSSSGVGNDVLDVLEQYHSRLKHVQRALHHQEFPSASFEPPLFRSSTSTPANHQEGVATTTTTTSPHNDDKATLRELAVHVCDLYSALPLLRLNVPSSQCARKAVLEYLARNCSSSVQSVDVAIEHYRKVREDLKALDHTEAKGVPRTTSHDHPSTVGRHVHLSQATARLRLACAPPYEWIVRSLLEQDTRRGLQFLLALRSDLRQYLACWNHHQYQPSSATTATTTTTITTKTVATPGAPSSPPTIGVDQEPLLLERCLKQLDHYLVQTFATWYAPGMLEIQRITYDTTPASIIETIAKHEAVHPVQSLEDLRRRLGPRRRVFGLFHPLLASSSNPLVVLHVSLQQEIPGTMDQVHHLSCSTNQPRVATFYSISNLQSLALAGVGLGEYLIKEAVRQLQNELPSLETFVTLSPLPGFRKWLDGTVHASGKFSQTPRDLLLSAKDGGKASEDLVVRLGQYLECNNELTVLAALMDRLDAQGPQSWKHQPDVVVEALERLAARYVVLEKHRMRPLDPVARFHISNGAHVHRVCVGADLTPKGWRTGWGCMVNYQYHLDEVAHNQARYEEDYTLPYSDHVRELL